MWTPATRGRMAKIEKKAKRYPSDLTDEEWARIEPFLPRASKAGRRIEVDLREVLNAIRYMARSGGGWRMLPNDFPPWQTVYWWFRRFVRRFMFQTIHDVALMLDREGGTRSEPNRGRRRQPIGQSSRSENKGIRRGQEDRGSQAPHRGRHRRPSSDGQSDARRHLRQRRGSDDPGRCAQALAVAEASVRRWGPMIAPNSSTKPPSGISPSRSSSDPTPPWASKSSRVDGSSSARSPG